jgi:hypothetical protein
MPSSNSRSITATKPTPESEIHHRHSGQAGFEGPVGDRVVTKAPIKQKLLRHSIFLLGSLAAVPSISHAGSNEGLDPGWMFWVHNAASLGLQWGRDVVFTYGPLGWISQPNTDFRFHLAISTVFVVAMHYVFISAMQRWTGVSPLTAAFGAVVVFTCTPAYPERFLCLIGFLSLRRRSKVKNPVLYDVAVAAGIAVLSLIKFGNGCIALILVIAAIACDALLPTKKPALESVSRILFLTPIFLGLGFLLMGQSISNFWAFVETSLEVAFGFSSSMQGTSNELRWTILLIPGLGLVTLYSARDRRGGLIMGLAFYFGIRLGFTRHDLIHYQSSLSLPLFVGLGLACSEQAGSRDQSRKRPNKSFIAPLVFSLTSLLTFQGNPGLWVGAFLRPTIENITFIGTAVHSVPFADSARFPSAPDLRSLLLRHSVSVDSATIGIEPWDLGLHGALAIRNPRQAPVFQRYSAYTENLDSLNANFIESPKGPEVLLVRRNSAIDQRLASAEAPRTMLALTRSYRFAGSSKNGEWALLKRRTRAEQAAKICTPSIVFTQKHVTTIEKLRSIFWPPQPLTTQVDGNVRRLTTASLNTPVLPNSDLPGLPGVVRVKIENSRKSTTAVAAGPSICIPRDTE